MCMSADGAAAVEALRAELARAKGQAWLSNAAAEKASAELKAEQAARRQDQEKMSSSATSSIRCSSVTSAFRPVAGGAVACITN